MAAPRTPEIPGGKTRSRTMPAAAALVIASGLALFEGTMQTPYRDKLAPGQPWTVCSGITGPDVIPGKRYSLFECHALEQRYIERMGARMGRCKPTAELSVYEWVAWGDFSYNLGTGRWCGSTALKLINRGQYRAACEQIPRWRFTDGKDCAVAANDCSGIIVRRAWPHATCLKGLQ
jgi:GH24 family phage-related lysozyme (muramidase)